MRAQFIRGQEPKESMGIGVDAKVYKFLKEIAEDYQLDSNDERYLGFINVYEDGFMNEETKEGFKIFVETWPKYEKLMTRMGLDTEEEPDIEETVFINKKPS